MHTCTHACMYDIQTNTQTCTQTHACASTQTRTHTFAQTVRCMLTNTHTHTHKQLKWSPCFSGLINRSLTEEISDHPEVIEMSTNQSSLHTNLASGRFYCKSLFSRAFISFMLLSLIYIYFPLSRSLTTKWFKISRGVTVYRCTIYCVAKSLQYVS